MKKAVEIRELTGDELQVRLRDAEAELLNLRIRQSSGQLDKPSRMREVRRGVARMKTILNERARAARSGK